MITLGDFNENGNDPQMHFCKPRGLLSCAVVMTAFVRWLAQGIFVLRPDTKGALRAWNCISWVLGQMHRVAQLRAMMGGEGIAQLNGLLKLPKTFPCNRPHIFVKL